MCNQAIFHHSDGCRSSLSRSIKDIKSISEIYDEEVTAASAEPSSSLLISTGATSYPRLPINH
ncbi:hypothetical protein T12_486 [Trichinella patagoniensis]|uniref:Uncharacterized protein n=1 Tax=Trichinella patagoniensis TaxID=990121 RepID=A0A0V0ZLQ2_9BILA|nr:hypothetical protein T12_486 [Trichinella patagoniensis]